MTLTLPWPPVALSPNSRVSRFVRAAATRGYRRAVAGEAWARGIDPVQGEGLTLARVVFHPPVGRVAVDRDNAVARFKAGQDGLADALGANDRGFAPEYAMGPPVPGGAVVAILDSIPG